MTPWPLQTAIYTALTGNAALMALVSGVHDDVPEDVVFPYVSIGESNESPWDTDDSTGAESVVVVHIWSRHRGQYEVKRIAAAVYDVLHRASMTVTGASVVTVEWESSTSELDPDGITRHGAMLFRVISEAT